VTFTASGIFYLTLRDLHRNDITPALDLLVDDIRAALFTNSLTTPNFDTNVGYGAAPFNANEVGTPSGGVQLASPTITVAAGSIFTFDANDTAWGSQTITNARGALVYDTSTTSPADVGLVGVTFGADFSVTSGILTIQWPSGGIYTYDLP
jgi:hypothetical protein